MVTPFHPHNTAPLVKFCLNIQQHFGWRDKSLRKNSYRVQISAQTHHGVAGKLSEALRSYGVYFVTNKTLA
ncbi:MAG: hypothetical protein BWX84_00657 [Verrucomicrobia bacterium ADurb.Bin118]|nr:MAG: hypothetical protein BWX84_00657 [Verrucomicrobia bacterium ADurb.Bin118]